MLENQEGKNGFASRVRQKEDILMHKVLDLVPFFQFQEFQ